MQTTTKPRIIHPEYKGVWKDIEPGMCGREVVRDGGKHYEFLVINKPYATGFIHATRQGAHARGHNQKGPFNRHFKIQEGVPGQNYVGVRSQAISYFR